MQHFNALNVAFAVGMNGADEVLTICSLFNTGPLNILTMPALAAGATVTIQREFDPGAMLEAIERRQVTLAISTPAMTKALLLARALGGHRFCRACAASSPARRSCARTFWRHGSNTA